MKNPYFTFLSPDNCYATNDSINPQLLHESLKSFQSSGDTMYNPADQYNNGKKYYSTKESSTRFAQSNINGGGKKPYKQCRIRSPPFTPSLTSERSDSHNKQRYRTKKKP